MGCIVDQDRGSWLYESVTTNRNTRAWVAPLGMMKIRARLAAVAHLQRGHAHLSIIMIRAITYVQGEEDDPEGALMAREVVTAADGAEHRGRIGSIGLNLGLLQLPSAARHGVPDGKLLRILEKLTIFA